MRKIGVLVYDVVDVKKWVAASEKTLLSMATWERRQMSFGGAVLALRGSGGRKHRHRNGTPPKLLGRVAKQPSNQPPHHASLLNQLLKCRGVLWAAVVVYIYIILALILLALD